CNSSSPAFGTFHPPTAALLPQFFPPDFFFSPFSAAFSFARLSIFRSSSLAILSALFCAFFESTLGSEVFPIETDS
ncbi:hypothetical protein BJV78DRAFT_1255797, partial [Lactifluus subvellereus]